jgi:hypothetical protein
VIEYTVESEPGVVQSRKRRSFTPAYREQVARMVVEELRPIPSAEREPGGDRPASRALRVAS